MERRSSFRIPVAARVLIYREAEDTPDGGPSSREIPVAIGRVLDLSRDGILLATALRGVRTGRPLELDLLLSNAGIDSHAHCRMIVRRKTDDGYALSVDPRCAFSRKVLSLLHRRYLGPAALVFEGAAARGHGSRALAS